MKHLETVVMGTTVKLRRELVMASLQQDLNVIQYIRDRVMKRGKKLNSSSLMSCIHCVN